MAVGKFNESIYMQDNPDEDQQLLQRLAAGDIRAFWPLWQKYQDYLFRCCIRWKNGNETEAEDLLSQAMLKAREKVQNYAGKIANFKSWVTALVRNFWLDMQRRPCAKQVEDIEVYAEREEVGLVSGGDTPASALEREDKKMVIRRAIDELPATMRETFMLHFYEELSHQEIAERQKVPYQNVCKRISQARAILAKKLRGYFIGEDGTEPDTAKVAAKPAKSKKPAQKAAQVEPILPETVTLSEQLEGDEELSHQEMGEPQEISCQNVGERFCEVPAILEGEDGTIMELAVMPVVREPAIEEMSQGNGEFEPVVRVPVTKSVAVAEVECVAGEELPVVAGFVGYSESDSVAGSYGGRLEEFGFIGKPVVGAFSRWLSKLEEDEEVSHQEMGNRQEIFCLNVGQRFCEVPAILEAEDGTTMELPVMPVGREPAIEEMSQGNGGVEPVVGVPVTKSVAVAEVECVAGQELPVVAGSVGDSESDSVAASSGGRLSEFNFIGKPVVGAFSRWLHCFGGSQLLYGIREWVLEVRVSGAGGVGATMGAGGESCGRMGAIVH
ncbi:MAG: sigma-70 family RNA polymerase sigma factor [Oscillatoria princeps RMCB-10]|jgi:RNA polymerase sigma factor (sigma-70 family)|nr:sigma-70 family RNA polymerase sigma factor [Oscillatoria princeps RMCB-10]